MTIDDLLDEARSHVSMYTDAIARFGGPRVLANAATNKKEEKESDYLERFGRAEVLRTKVLPRFEAMVELFEKIQSGKTELITYI